MARGLCEKQGQVPPKARRKARTMANGTRALAKSLRDVPSTRACIAPTLAAIAPEEALEPIADAMASTPEAATETRAVLERRSPQLAAAPNGALGGLLGDGRRGAAARLEMMRAAGARSPKLQPRATPQLRSSCAERRPCGRVTWCLVHSKSWAARARAQPLRGWRRRWRTIPSGLFERGPRKPVPRSRSCGTRLSRGLAIRPRACERRRSNHSAASPSPDAVLAARSALAEDGWSFVRVQAVAVSANPPPSGGTDEALGGALHDPSAGVRGGPRGAGPPPRGGFSRRDSRAPRLL